MIRRRLLLAVLTIALLLLLVPAQAPAEDLSWLAPDALGMAKPTCDPGATLDMLSWQLAEPWGHRIWLDVFRPFAEVGAGVSADVKADGPLCAGAGFYDDAWTLYLGGHFGVNW